MEMNHKKEENTISEKKKILIVEDQFIEAYDLQLMIENAGYSVCGKATSVAEALELIEVNMPDLVLLDIFLKGKLTGIDLAQQLKERHIGFIYISANSGKSTLDLAKTTQPYGFIIKPFREQDVLTTLEIAFYRQQYSLESEYIKQIDVQSNISEIPFQDSWEEVLVLLASEIQKYIPFDYMEAGFSESADYAMTGLMRKPDNEYQLIVTEKLSKLAESDVNTLSKMQTIAPSEKKIMMYQGEELLQNCRNSEIRRLIIQTFRIKSFVVLPIEINGALFNFFFYSRESNFYRSSHLTLLSNIEGTLTKFVKKHLLQNGPAMQKSSVTEKTLQKVEPIGFGGMVGSSPKMNIVFDYIKKVAPLDISVLILGENGTGKEKVAHSIHALSKRKDNPFIVVNCGAIPENLAESLLFGHEKGAFTGAVERRIGKFELAEGGTIFLDEIGEMPIEIQVKLLRVLQEREIDRVGGKSPVKTDVRIIAATNKNLEAEVASGRFRMDLYYRLHVFPIVVPSLRDRKEDIPTLTAYFCADYCQKIGKEPSQFSKQAISQMLNYNWPGNIRELEHFIQRNLVLCDDTLIKEVELPGMSVENRESSNRDFSIRTIDENEKEHILYVLQKCNWKISGSGGAAEMLDLHPSTLNSKIKKLDIRKV